MPTPVASLEGPGIVTLDVLSAPRVTMRTA